jgi:hypothetical protein
MAGRGVVELLMELGFGGLRLIRGGVMAYP